MYIEERLNNLENENKELKRKILELERVVLKKTNEEDRVNEEKIEKKDANKTIHIKERIELDKNLVFKKLKSIRLELANIEKLPAYYIVSNQALNEMAEKLPLTEWELLEINGIGDKKLDKYGHIFLESIKKIKNDEDLDIKECVRVKKKVLRDPALMKSHIMTYDHYLDGEGLKEIARSRMITPYTAVRELIQCKKEGLEVDLDILIEDKIKKIIVDTYNFLEIKEDNELKKALPANIENYEIKIALYGVKN